MKQVLLILVVLPLTLLAQDQAPTGGRPGGGRIQTATRSVTKYTHLENNLFQALQDNNRAGLDNLLASDFEAWAAEKPSPAPRDPWMQTFLGNLKSFRIRNMAVHDYADVSVVSFLLERSGTQNGKPMSPVLFVVDVWKHDGDKLAVRYASAPAKPAPDEKRPTGKE